MLKKLKNFFKKEKDVFEVRPRTLKTEFVGDKENSVSLQVKTETNSDNNRSETKMEEIEKDFKKTFNIQNVDEFLPANTRAISVLAFIKKHL